MNPRGAGHDIGCRGTSTRRFQDVTMVNSMADATAQAPAAAAEPQTYDLRAAEGPKRLLVKLTVRGITVSNDGLAWTGADGARSVRFADIAAIHLGAGLIGQATLDTCRITFSDGGGLATADWGANGLPDDKQLPVYRAFVRDLHARLAAQPGGAVRFTAGFPQWRYNILCGAVVCFALMWVAALLAMLFLAPGLKGLGVVIAGAFLLFPLAKLVLNTKPRDYTPDNLPEALLS
jgi:hypothetical protein